MEIKQDYIPKNKYSRPGKTMKTVKGIVVHGTACPRATAKNIRDYFANTGPNQKRYASSQFVIGLEGEIIEIMPANEVAYHVGSRTYTHAKREYLGKGNPNYCTIGIELCHEKADGKFNQKTLDSCIQLIKYLKNIYRLPSRGKTIWQHKQVVGWKDCPFSLVYASEKWNDLVNQASE